MASRTLWDMLSWWSEARTKLEEKHIPWLEDTEWEAASRPSETRVSLVKGEVGFADKQALTALLTNSQ